MANPYDFVPFFTVQRKQLAASAQHSKLCANLLSGTVKCSLTVRSPLSIRNLFEELSRQSSEVFIPGSSIKGMVRTTMEALYGGCGFKIERDYHYDDRKFPHPKKKYEFKIIFDVKDCFFPDSKFAEGVSAELSQYANCSRRIDEALKQMSDAERKTKTIRDFPLCPICSLFGLTASTSISYAGRFTFEDSPGISVKLQRIELPRPDQPRVYRRGFYFKNPSALPDYTETFADNGKDKFRVYAGGEYNGRKFYLHAQNGEITPVDSQRKDNQTVYAVPPHTQFTFKIHFTNLSDDELGMLLFALKLEAGMCHKLGYGKPWGLGSVKIEPGSIKLLNQSAYTEFDSTDLFQDDGVGVSKRIEEFKQQYRKASGKEITQMEHFKRLRAIWDCQGQALAYPDLKKFFGKKEFENTTIQEFNEWWEAQTSPKPTPSKTISKQPSKKATSPSPSLESTSQTKPKPEPDEKILELSISKIEKNQPFVTVEGKEIKVIGYVPEMKVGAIVRGFIKTKKDGSVEFIQRAKKD